MFSRAKFLGVRDGILGEMVEEYKYSSVRELSLPISEIVYEAGIFPEYFERFEKKNARTRREKRKFLRKERPGEAEKLEKVDKIEKARGVEKLRRSVKSEKIFIVPMPTSRKHIRERGFDHIDKVAREIERISEGRVERLRILERAKDTVQVGADEETRKRQAKEAVRVSPRFLGEDGKVLEEYSGQRLVILDDVWTTGASLTEAGKLLKRAGVKKVDALAITKNRQGRSPMIRGENEMFWGV